MVTATDNAGNQATTSHGYTVFARWSGPVHRPPTVNTVNAGRSIPIVFSLPGNAGPNIFETGYPKSQNVGCQTWTSSQTNPIESTTSTPAGLTYDTASDNYTYVWKSNKAWTGTCRQLILQFAADVPHHGGARVVFNFQFT